MSEGERLPVIQEVIVVEGFHDKQVVERAVSAEVWVLGGDRIKKEVLDELRRASRVRGLLILTDPDGPGERIRARIDREIPGCRHAFLARKEALGKGAVGVEHASVEVVREALLRARASGSSSANLVFAEDVFTMQDLIEAGLVNSPQARERREVVAEQLGIGQSNGKALLKKLNALGVTRPEWENAIARLADYTDTHSEGEG